MSDPTESKPQVDPKSDRYADLHRELMIEARWRRDQDRNLITLFIAVCAIFANGIFSILSKDGAENDRNAVLLFGIGATILVGFWVIVKICWENKHYKTAGKGVVRIWKHWNLIDDENISERPLTKDAVKFGKGKGFGWSVAFVILLGLWLIFFIVRIGTWESLGEGKLRSGLVWIKDMLP
jgi:hypothetical protein